MTRFSVVVPVYNVAPYLEECLESLRGQTFGDWEAICVDDGSTDGSGAMLDRLASEERRFQVVHQANKGLSGARNTGLDKAGGEYLLFLDGDDRLTPDALEVLDSAIDGEDVVRFGGEHCDSVCAVIRCYRRAFLEAHGLRFLEGILHEDNLFTPQVDYYARRVKMIDKDLYLYRQREGSIMATKGVRHYRDLLRVANLLAAFFVTKEDIDPRVVYRRITHHYQVAFAHSDREMDRQLLPLVDWRLYRKVSRTRLRHRVNYAAMRVSPGVFRWINGSWANVNGRFFTRMGLFFLHECP